MMSLISSLYNKFYGKFLKIVNFKVGIPMLHIRLMFFRDFSEFVGVSVKELVKAMGESRANGNGATPPETPRRTSRSSSPKNPQGSPRFHSPSSSPVPIPGIYAIPC